MDAGLSEVLGTDRRDAPPPVEAVLATGAEALFGEELAPEKGIMRGEGDIEATLPFREMLALL